MQQNEKQIQGLEGDELNQYPEGTDFNREPSLDNPSPVEIKPISRYQVGQKLITVCFHFDGKPPMLGVTMPYLYDMKAPTKIDLIQLEVIEEHNVPNAHAPKDGNYAVGYVLKDDHGRIWHNQYPLAYYGQVSDEGNRTFSRHAATKEEATEILNSGESHHTYLLSEFFGNLSRGISHFSDNETINAITDEEKRAAFTEKLNALVGLRDTIVKMVKDQFSLVFQEYPIWEEHPDITAFRLVPESVDKLTQHVDDCIEKCGFFMQGVSGVGIYSVGFYKHNKPELMFSIGDDSLVDIFNRLCEDHMAGRLPIDKVFNCKWAKVGGKPMRCIIVTQGDLESEWIAESFAHFVHQRDPNYRKFAIIQIADANNRLPHEAGYDLGDQTIVMMKHNMDALNASIREGEEHGIPGAIQLINGSNV